MDFLEQLNPRQREAVEHTEGPLLILAGAGSGKTRVITRRIAYLIRGMGHWPGSILAVTFTNKAAGEMRERVAALLGPEPGRQAAPVVSTFHSFCVRLLRREGAPLARLRPGFTTKFSIYDDGDQLSLVKAVYKELGLDEKAVGYRSALARISEAKNQRLTPHEYFRSSNHPWAEKLAVVYEHYESALVRANAMDFDDLLLEAVRLLRADEAVRSRMGERFHYLMVDEYQDTNRTQYELVRLLGEPRRNLCVVGDEDQSIYGWRGADIRNILDFERDFPGARLIRLEQNYRSTKNILEAAGAVVAHNIQRKGKTLWTESGAGAKILLHQAEDSESEALFLADYVGKYLARNPGERAAVLYRTNFQSRPIEEALRRNGRKYLLVGGLSFYQRAEVKDMLAYLKASSSPQDSVSLLRIINTPARGIGRTTVEQIERHALERGLHLSRAVDELAEAGGLPARAQAALAGFRELMGELRDHLAREPLNEVLVWLKQRTGYQRMLEQDSSPESEGRIENLDELVNAAADAVGRGETVEEFLDQAALVADTDDLDEAAQVTLLTLHSAKGLEFDLVMLAGMEEGVFPHRRAMEETGGAVEEERRLCYVGLTRARRQLALTLARRRRRYGGGEFEDTRPSRFLREVPGALLEDRSAPGPRRLPRPAAFAGKTYNSAENIAEFFAARGIPMPRTKAPPAGGTRAAAPIGRRGFRAGAHVRHPKYGAGVVLRREGDGEDAKITVSFPHHGVKKLIEKYATLSQE